MSSKQDPKAEGVVGKYSTTDTSDAAISEVHPATNDRILRNVVFAGIRTKQIEIKDVAAKLSNEASTFFVSQLAAAVRESIVLTPGITPHELKLNRSRIYIDTVAEYFRELKAATSAIDEKYTHIGGSLGNPVTGVEFGGKDYEIPYRKYEHGAIYVTSHGTHEVHGAIYQKYVALGAEASFLGFPETDEQGTTLGTGRFNHFQGGSIYWTLPTGARAIHGPIRDRWWQMGGDQSYLGFPVSDVEQTPEGSSRVGLVSYFQRGNLELQSEGAFQDLSHSVMLKTSLEGGSVKCSAELWMNSAGDWRYFGHLHNDGFAGTVATVATTLLFRDDDGKSFAVGAERSLGGTLDSESRNDDWDQVGSKDEFIRKNWKFIQFSGMRSVMKTGTTFGDVLAILIPVGWLLPLLARGSADYKPCGPYGSSIRNPTTGQNSPNTSFGAGQNSQPCP